MPAVSALNQMSQTALEMQTFIRSYALPHLTQEDRNNLIDVLAAIRKKRAAQEEFYLELPKTKEEQRLWDELTEITKVAVSNNNQFISNINKLVAQGASPETLGKWAKSQVIDGEIDRALTAYQQACLKLVIYEEEYYGKIKPEEAITLAYQLIILSIITSIVGFVAAIIVGFRISESITKPVISIVEVLNKGAREIGEASNQLAITSQELASVTEQASGLEETTSSLEELGAMVAQNSENSGHSNVLAQKASEADTKRS